MREMLSCAVISVLLAAAVIAIAAPDKPTPSMGTGPNYVASAPFRAKISPPLAEGEVLVVRGVVLGIDGGDPIPHAVLDVFHTDAQGNYHDDAYRARVQADEHGYYEFETVRPRHYSGRSAHVHFVIHADGYRTLATELLLKDDLAGPDRERLPPELIVEPVRRGSGKRSWVEATFDIVLEPLG